MLTKKLKTDGLYKLVDIRLFAFRPRFPKLCWIICINFGGSLTLYDNAQLGQFIQMESTNIMLFLSDLTKREYDNTVEASVSTKIVSVTELVAYLNDSRKRKV